MGMMRQTVMANRVADVPGFVVLEELDKAAGVRQERLEKLLSDLLVEQQTTNRWLAHMSSQLPPKLGS